MNLLRAWHDVRRSRGAPGADGISITEVARRTDQYLLSLQHLLLTSEYRPRPVRLVRIPKAESGYRTIGIPSVLDRIVGRAVLNVVAPHVDETFSEVNFAFRKGISVRQALARAMEAVGSGSCWALKADIHDFFPSVRHTLLIDRLRSRFDDPHLLHLLSTFVAGAGDSSAGVPTAGQGILQGSVLSPLFANIYLDPLDRTLLGLGVTACRYVDDMICLAPSQDRVQDALSEVERQLRRLGLRLSERKSGIVHIRDGLPFLGFLITPRGLTVPPATLRQFRAHVRRLSRDHLPTTPERLAAYVRGWFEYYHSEATAPTLARVRRWLRTYRSQRGLPPVTDEQAPASSADRPTPKHPCRPLDRRARRPNRSHGGDAHGNSSSG